MITKVFYRATETESDWNGDNAHSWFGEDETSINDVMYGRIVTKIDYGTVNNGQEYIIYFWDENSKLIMSLPWHSVCRVIHD